MRATQADEILLSAPGAGAVASPRDRLLNTANDLFYRRGIHTVGIDEVIAAAGVAKMSLYRSFPSKDELIAAYLARRSGLYWDWWDRVVARHPGNPLRQLLALTASLRKRALRASYRGCPFTNAACEFPEPDHPARRIAEANKREMRRRFRALAKAAGARSPARLADQLTLLFEGAYASVLTFGHRGPARSVVDAAATMIDAQLAKPADSAVRRSRSRGAR
ncbi:MAG: TetR/AcrR family transcriptional regulator [Alphaproteobacteria bacterium]|nr:TetR/AcrR family transcriptional regulator [Alphaproteobacteria bacterium]